MRTFTNQGFDRPEIYRLFFKAALTELRSRNEAYEAEVKDWYENGDGRSPHWVTDLETGQRWNEGGQGYRFPTCIHGANLWVDHDIPCGYCEMGESDISIAQGNARERFARFNSRWDWVTKAPADLAYETRNELFEWAYSIFPGYVKKGR